MKRKGLKGLFIKLKIVQAVSNKDRRKEGLKRLGKGYFEAYRLNPLNPVSYLLILLYIPFLFLVSGLSGFKNQENPFKWN